MQFLDLAGVKKFKQYVDENFTPVEDHENAEKVAAAALNNLNDRLTDMEDGTGEENVIEAITFNGSVVPINNSTKTAAIMAKIPHAETDSSSTATAFTATVPGITTLEDGVCCYIKNTVIASAAGCTLNINNLGAKPIYVTTAAATAATTQFAKNYTFLFIYNANRISGGCWDIWQLYNTNTTYSAITTSAIQAGTATTGRTVTAAVLAENYNITDGTINIAGNSITPLTEENTYIACHLVISGNSITMSDGRIRQSLIEDSNFQEFNYTEFNTAKSNGKIIMCAVRNSTTDCYYLPFCYTDSTEILFSLQSGTEVHLDIDNADHLITQADIYWTNFNGTYNSLVGKPTIPTDSTVSGWGFAKTASPALTGTPTAPTAAASTNNAQIATTAFVKTAINNLDLSDYVAFDSYNGDQETIASALTDLNTNKQATLVSGTNIKTINNESLLGSGNITIESGSSDYLPLSGGSLDDGASLLLEHTENKNLVIIDPIDASVMARNDESRTYTKYTNGSIIRGSTSPASSRTISLPSSAGTLALTSDIPTNISDLENDSEYLTSEDLAEVAITGSYNDLYDKPTIPDPTIILSSSGELNSNVQGVFGISRIEGNDGLMYALGSNNADGSEDYILATTDQIPTESTISNWGFTKTDKVVVIECQSSQASDLDNVTRQDIFLPTSCTYTYLNDLTSQGYRPVIRLPIDSGAYSYDFVYSNKEAGATLYFYCVEYNKLYIITIESDNSKFYYSKNYLASETDPVFSASAAAGITASDITNWNGKTSNTGTVTGVKINGTTKNPTSGVVDLGTVLTSYTETDPTVPSWAKAASKPTYTASEVGALPDTTVIPSAPGTLKTNATTAQTASSGEVMSGTITLHKIAKTGTYSDLIGTPTIPTKVSDLTNDSNFTSNVGTITGITMNGSSKGTSGVVNLGTVLTSHQDISGKADLSGATFTGAVTGTSSGNTAQFRNITISSSEPTSSDGSNGDIWIVI